MSTRDSVLELKNRMYSSITGQDQAGSDLQRDKLNGGLASDAAGRWKMVLCEQCDEGQPVWGDPYFSLRAPKLYDLRMDPFKKANHDSNTYEDWWVRWVYLFAPVQAFVANFLKTFKEFPARQKPAAFNLDQVMDQLYKTGSH